ncbi:AraC family transcriptional regulator ligand-binding domain-containing protein [Pseudomonas aeruginosa]|uniref:AraC family transcriptional regulator ligand-binding domain-containing protein n=1 Tax=Pseudomonas aeruginosa TaxID=287 RepID=UPI003F3E4224
MSELDKIIGERANPLGQRTHRGFLGRVLERYLRLSGPHRPEYPLAELERLWSEAAEHDQAIGLHLLAYFTPQDLPLLVYHGIFSPDIRCALEGWVRYAVLHSGIESLAMIDEGARLALQLSVNASPTLSRYMLEHQSSMTLQILRQASGADVRPVQACFTHAPPGYYKEYERILCPDIQFNAACNRLYFDPPTLGIALRTRHPAMREALSHELERQLANHQRVGGWAGKIATEVKQAIARGESPCLENLARVVHQSPRTLRRRLAEQGLTFRQVIDLARAEMERTHEAQGAHRAEIARLLGYSEVTAYLHARKRWANK